MIHKKTDSDSIINKIYQLEKLPVIRQYLEWKTYPPENKMTARQQWRTYYDECKKTPSAQRFVKINEASKNGDNTEIKRLAQEAREALQNGVFIKQPYTIDPYLMDNDFSIHIYKSLKIKLELEKRNNGVVDF